MILSPKGKKVKSWEKHYRNELYSQLGRLIHDWCIKNKADSCIYFKKFNLKGNANLLNLSNESVSLKSCFCGAPKNKMAVNAPLNV